MSSIIDIKISRRRAATVCLVLAVTLALVGCGGAGDEATLSGQLTYAGDAPIPDDAAARVSLIALGDRGDIERRIVAERSLHDPGQKPIEFALTFERTLVDADGSYGVRAEILDADGYVRWQTPDPVPVKPLSPQPTMKLSLEPVPTPEALAFTKYRCADGFLLSVVMTSGEAVVRLGNRRLVLTSQAASGSQLFTDAHGNALTIDSRNGMQFKVDGGSHADCTPVAEKQAVGRDNEAPAQSRASRSGRP